MADQENPKPPAGIVYEDTGAAAPLVYFDIVAAYGTRHHRGRARDPHSRAQAGRRNRGEISFIGAVALQSDRRHQSAQRARCRAEDAGAAAGQCGRDHHDELRARSASSQEK